MVSQQLYLWLFIVGYLLAFGTILAKMYRVYQIFHRPSPNKKVCIITIIMGIIICVIHVCES